MLPSERQEEILNRLTKYRFASVEDLSSEFNVTPTTIRRDLEKLEESGLVVRSYGGARLKNEHQQEEPYAEKAVASLDSKRAIAGEAMKLVEDGMTVILDAGTTTMEIAKLLAVSGLHVTAVTNDLPIASLLLSVPGIEVLVLGGKVIPETKSTQGELALQNFSSLNCDIAFIGTSAIQPDGVLYTPTEEKGVLKRKMIEKSGVSVLVTDASKYKKSGLYRVAELSDFDILITDIKWSAREKKNFKDLGIKLIQVKGDENGTNHRHRG